MKNALKKKVVKPKFNIEKLHNGIYLWFNVG